MPSRARDQLEPGRGEDLPQVKRPRRHQSQLEPAGRQGGGGGATTVEQRLGRGGCLCGRGVPGERARAAGAPPQIACVWHLAPRAAPRVGMGFCDSSLGKGCLDFKRRLVKFIFFETRRSDAQV